ncbi:diguanylate cyclase domain-containing protein [Butyrivibrio sp.]|jgi:diguanylate cyclase (GGDEF)-like protein|uniref:diguanylate cyclase domain-containing protein n=1 Tax=Butyrivibrio sp. TaxID=28121 RepID=UPI0025B95A13|nr:diguanylate cyclase [Butyrivibrio sp.]
MSKKRSITIGLVTFVLALIATTVIGVIYLSSVASTRRERAAFMAGNIANRIEAEIKNRDYITRLLEIEVKNSDGALTQERFYKVGEALFDDYLDVVDISIAPDGIVTYVYPLQSAFTERKNLFDDKVEGVYLDNSKQTGVGIILAPVTLPDGSYGIIIRRPIYLGDGRNNGDFWGFASVTISLSSFLSDVNISGIADEGYEYKLIGNDVITGDSGIIMEYSEKALATPVEAMISTVGGGYWTLELSPLGNWMEAYEILSAFGIIFIISILFALNMAAFSSLKANTKELEVMSYRDALTNLYNPRSYQEHMEELSRKKLPYGLIFIDLNDFKKVNDTYGHETGDALLNIVAKRLQNSIREKDRAFRIGGDEFVVVIHGTHDKRFYENVISRMRQNVARNVVIGDITLRGSISAGYARCPEDGTKFEDVVKKADDAMYNNKRLIKASRNGAANGRNL